MRRTQLAQAWTGFHVLVQSLCLIYLIMMLKVNPYYALEDDSTFKNALLEYFNKLSRDEHGGLQLDYSVVFTLVSWRY